MLRHCRALFLALLAAPAAAEPPVVVADIAPVHSLVAQVMGDLGSPVLLVEGGGDAHDFQLRPSQARALAEAELLFWVGPELTPWLDRALRGAGIAGAAVALLHAEGTQARVYGAATIDDDRAEGATDPHAWLDPANATAWLAEIAARLAEADPENAARYAANAEAAQAALAALDGEVRATLAPAQGRALFFPHDAYGYFAAAYGLTVAGALAEGDAAPSGAARISGLRAGLAAAAAPCVFAEAGESPGLAAALAGEAGLPLGLLDPAGMLIEPGPELYGTLMRGLAAAVADCR